MFYWFLVSFAILTIFIFKGFMSSVPITGSLGWAIDHTMPLMDHETVIGTASGTRVIPQISE